MKTEYRTISDGYKEFLQYKKKHSFLFVVWYSWEYIWNPYCHRTWGRELDATGSNTFVCDRNNHLDKFVRKWPNIHLYFEWANEQQKNLELEISKQNVERNKKKGEIKYF